jgi:hypothetical protein
MTADMEEQIVIVAFQSAKVVRRAGRAITALLSKRFCARTV